MNKDYGPTNVRDHFSLYLPESYPHGNGTGHVGQGALGKALLWWVLAVDRPGPICSGSMGSNSQAFGVCEPTRFLEILTFCSRQAGDFPGNVFFFIFYK